MFGRPKRDLPPRVDYKELGRTGKRVPVDMDLDEKKITQSKIASDIKEFFELNVLDDLDSEDELRDAVETASKLSKKYRDIHTELKALLFTEYAKEYPKSEDIHTSLTEFVKNVKKKIRDLKKSAETSRIADETSRKNEHKSEEKRKLRSEYDFVLSKIERKFDSYDWSTFQDAGEISDGIRVFDVSYDDWYSVHGKLKGVFEAGEYLEFEEKFNEFGDKISDKITEGKKRLKDLQIERNDAARKFDDAQQEAEQQRRSDEILKREEEEKVRKSDYENRAKNMSKEIELLKKALDSSCGVDLKSLSDHHLIDLRKNIPNYKSDLGVIMDKVTSFSSLVPHCGKAEETLLTELIKVRDDSASTVMKFSDELGTIILSRDITEGKLKNVLELKPEIPKFEGYDSKMDIYTFRKEFEKLIEPALPKPRWADYLKTKYLAGNAFILVDQVDSIDEIWTKLTSSYGNMRLLLQKKISSLDKHSGFSRITADEKVAVALSSITNIMTELLALAKKFSLEEELYYGGCLEKILSLLGSTVERKFVSKCKDNTPSKPSEWTRLTEFLEKEISVRERLTLLDKSKKCLGIENRSTGLRGGNANQVCALQTAGEEACEQMTCHICDKNDHVAIRMADGRCDVPYYACDIFVNMSADDRRKEIFNKKFCTQCLEPGVRFDEEHTCSKEYICPHRFHKKFKRGLHVLVCSYHKSHEANKNLCEKFRKSIAKTKYLKNFSKQITINFSLSVHVGLPNSRECAIFMFQTIVIDGHRFNLFFDNGCGDMVIKKSALDILLGLNRATLEKAGPIPLSGVGDVVSWCQHGKYSIRLPLKRGGDVVLTGLCLDKVTTEFPTYPLSEVTKDAKSMSSRSVLRKFPKMPEEVGGETHILVGVLFNDIFPDFVHKFPSGLAVHDSHFEGPDGSSGVFVGPHPEFSKAERDYRGNHSGHQVYYQQPKDIFHPETMVYRTHSQRKLDAPLLGSNEKMIADPTLSMNSLVSEVCICKRLPQQVKQFRMVDNAGTEIDFRCVDCRNCPICLRSPRLEMASIEAERDQHIIDKCVTVDIENNVTMAKLPFTCAEPDLKLASNEKSSVKNYKVQSRKLEKLPEDQQKIIESERKLHDLGYVCYYDDLSVEEKALFEGKVNYYIPWGVQWNENSVSTEVRLVFDASRSSPGGCGLNSLLGKGLNTMNKMIEILNRFTTYPHVYHTDIKKMYNAVHLDKNHWRYQMYHWRDDLSAHEEPRIKVIKTLIYGVRPSGALAERGLRLTAEKMGHLYPRAAEVINNDVYVDDCASGEMTVEERSSTTNDVRVVLGKGGFDLKGFTFSGSDPPAHLSKDGKTIMAFGMKYHPKSDKWGLNIKELNFANKNRGKKPQKGSGVIPENLTMVDCAGKLGEIFDPQGKVAPLVASMKLDMHDLHTLKLDWDNPIPANLREIWLENFKTMKGIGDIWYQRAVIPVDAVNLNMETVDTGDASNHLACAAIYVRFKRTNGEYSCQLIFAKTKLIPDDMSTPRGELMAAILSAVAGHIVKLSLGDRIKRTWKITDSQVALFWINCTRSVLKLWVRNRVVEVNRLTDVESWRYVEGKDNPADIGTRRGAKIADVSPGSIWIRGHDWMSKSEEEFPVKTATELVLSAAELQEAKKESYLDPIERANFVSHVWSDVEHDDELDLWSYMTSHYRKPDYKARYEFSNYVIDPLKWRFRKVVRVLALVYLFVRNLKRKVDRLKVASNSQEVPEIFGNQYDKHIVTTGCHIVGNPWKCLQGLVVIITDDLINMALNYYFEKATREIVEFVDKSNYEKISELKENILYYSGRILSDQEFGGAPSLGIAAFDLTTSTFCVPLSDYGSPIAKAIVGEVHWYHPDVNHRGVESMLRYVQRIVYVIGGRDLVASLKKNCVKCRLLAKKSLRAAMGPVQDVNFCIAPAFYYTQVDICGPFNSYSNANKRATVKIWFTVFCCCVTGAVDCLVMEDYGTEAFILAFTRFACRYGYPKRLLPDEGSQLVKACKEMVISFTTIKNMLMVEYGVEFETCPVGAHYVHGKVERKIQEIKKSIYKVLDNRRLSVMQWETLGLEIANSINNMPIGVGNRCANLENLDILTPNRLILGRNNDRCPSVPLELAQDYKRIVETNKDIFNAWFNAWLVSYVPLLMERPKWYESDREVCIGDVVLFLKDAQAFDLQYQYGKVINLKRGSDNKVRTVEVEYQNHTENVKRTTTRGIRDLVIIHQVDELSSHDTVFYLRSLAAELYE